jgi:hypothetical protein
MISLARSKTFLMVDAEVLEPVEHQAIIGAEAVGVNHTLRYNFGADDLTQRFARDIFNDPGVDLAVALQEPENGHFAGCAATSWAFAAASEVRLVALEFAAKRAMPFAFAGQAAADDLINAFGAVAVDAHHFSGAARRHFEREVLNEFIELTVCQLTVSE